MRSRLFVLLFILLTLASGSLQAQQSGLKTYTTDDGTFSFVYPSDWFVEVINADQPNAHLSVDNLPLDKRFDSPTDINLQISLPQQSFLVGNGIASPREALAQMMPGAVQPATLEFATASPNGTPQPLQIQPAHSTIEDFEIDGRPAAYSYNEMRAFGVDASQIIIIADVGNDYWISISATSYKGGMTNLHLYEPVILEIVKSIHYAPKETAHSGNPDLPQLYTGVDGIWGYGYLEYNYPADWYAYYSFTSILTNKPNGLMNAAPKAGQFIATIIGVAETRADVDQTALFDQCGPSTSTWTAQTLVTQMFSQLTPARLQQLKDAGIATTQPEIKTVNGKDMVYFRQYQGNIEVLVIYVDLGNGNVQSMSITANKGELAPFEDQLFVVAGTFQYTPKPCPTPTPADSSGT